MITNTQTIIQEITPELLLRLTAAATSEGRTLENDHSTSIRSIPRYRENRIAQRLGNLQSQGREAKISSLIKRLKESNLSLELRAEVNNWLELFSSIDVGAMEDRAYALASLIIKVLRPPLVQAADGEKVQVDHFIIVSQDILQQMLPMGALDGFLKDCESALREERIYRVMSARLAFAGQVEMRAINNNVREWDTRIRELYESLKQRVIARQENCRNMVSSADSAVDGVTARVEALGSQLLTQMTAIRHMGSMDPELVNSLNELESIFRRGLR